MRRAGLPRQSAALTPGRGAAGAALTTAVDEDKILSSNPCRIRGAGGEQAPERHRVVGIPGAIFPALREHFGAFVGHDAGALANSGAALKDLMTRMGHDSERAALIYQHVARGADQRITEAIDFHLQAERDDQSDDDGPAGTLVPAG